MLRSTTVALGAALFLAALAGCGSSPSTSGESTVPPAPTGVSAEAGNGQATVSWNASSDSKVTRYTVTSSPGGLQVSVNAPATTATVSGLSNGTAYTFTVVATSPAGESAPSSPSNSVTPRATTSAPNSPSGVVATTGDGQANVTWSAPASDGGAAITQYVVTSSPGSVSVAINAPNTSAVVAGLTNGTTYTFTVVARNAVGDSAPSAPSNAVTPSQVTVPDAPSGVVAARGNAQATLSWSAPQNDGGSPITKYTVTSSPGGLTATASAPVTTATVTGLANGVSYTFTVVATNATGDSAPSTPSNAVTPATNPDAPSNASATAGDAKASVSWSAPASNGGVPILSYTVTASPGGLTTTAPGSATSVDVSPLQNGTTYTLSVVATNDVGDSAAATSSEVTPLGPPDAPTGVSAVAGDGEAIVSWTAPFDGGSAITHYTVTATGGKTARVSGSETSVRFPRLNNGTAYTFTVVATNVIGDSAASNASTAVSPNALTNFCASGAGEPLGAYMRPYMQGCPGAVTFDQRASLCGPGTHVCTADEWRVGHGSTAPTHIYWTDDALNLSKVGACGKNGCSSGACFATRGLAYGTACPSNQPMRVCGSISDSEGNTCNFVNCGMDSVSPNEYFGGCTNNTTAGTLCCSRTQHYFVDPAGSDGNVGTSAGSPLKTIGAATSVAMSGDTIYVAPGIYSAPVFMYGGVNLIGDEGGRGASSGPDGGVLVTAIEGGADAGALVSASSYCGPYGCGAPITVAGFEIRGTNGAPAGIDLGGGGGVIRNDRVTGFDAGISADNRNAYAVIVENAVYGNTVGYSANGYGYVGYNGDTLGKAENNSFTNNEVGIRLAASYSDPYGYNAGLDLGGGTNGGIGNNVIACNASHDLYTEVPTSATGNAWNHTPPRVTDAGVAGYDIQLGTYSNPWFGSSGTVNVSGYLTPITTCDGGVTP